MRKIAILAAATLFAAGTAVAGQLEQRLMPFQEMLLYRPFLLDQRPRFVDFDLYGMLANFLYSGRYRLPAAHTQIKGWYRRMTRIQHKSFAREKELHS